MLDFFDNRILLAPMAGVNDPVFRAICKRMGAAFTYTEMISSKGLSYKNQKTQSMISSMPEDRPYAVQLFGTEPEVMAEQAKLLEEQFADDLVLIDINMGCPARKVASGGSGAALLQQPELAREIIQAVSAAVQLPVTVKMRLVNPQTILSSSQPTCHPERSEGSSLSVPDTDVGSALMIKDGTFTGNTEHVESTLAFACMAEEAGAAAVTIHGRTAAQMYHGTAHKQIVAQLAHELSIPVIASGDVNTQQDIDTYLELGAAAVMAARGARGNPWIFQGVTPTYEEVIAIAREHTERLHAWDAHKLVWMRKHLAWYFKGLPHAVQVRKAVQTAVTLDDYLRILDECERYA